MQALSTLRYLNRTLEKSSGCADHNHANLGPKRLGRQSEQTVGLKEPPPRTPHNFVTKQGGDHGQPRLRVW